MAYTKSSACFKRARKVIPGGVNSPVRAFKSVNIDPVFIKEGKGSKVLDVDNNEYIDYICSWGPLIFGHSSPITLDGVYESLQLGTSFGVPTPIEIDMAELIVEAYPSIDMVRMVNSGTEATMSALRVARGYTGRDKILKFEGCYHGHADSLLVKSGSGTLTYGVPTSAGVTASTVEDTLVGKFNDIDMLKDIFKENKNQIAAVIVEPIPGNMGLIPPNKEFLTELRKITKDEGSVLIFDEVITGFRVALGGAGEVFDIEPDMTCLGKIIGGGMPVGAYGGKRHIMQSVSPLGDVYQAGTLSGNPLAMKMGLNTLQYLKNNKDVYDIIEKKAMTLEKGFKENINKTGIQASVNRVKGMISLFFTNEIVQDYSTALKTDTEMYAKYFKEMLKRGILLPPSNFECMFLSTAHSDEDINRTLKASLEVFNELSK